MRGHQDSVHSAEFLMFSNIILSSSVDKTLMLWDARTVNSKEKINLKNKFPVFF